MGANIKELAQMYGEDNPYIKEMEGNVARELAVKHKGKLTLGKIASSIAMGLAPSDSILSTLAPGAYAATSLGSSAFDFEQAHKHTYSLNKASSKIQNGESLNNWQRASLGLNTLQQVGKLGVGTAGALAGAKALGLMNIDNHTIFGGSRLAGLTSPSGPLNIAMGYNPFDPKSFGSMASNLANGLGFSNLGGALAGGGLGTAASMALMLGSGMFGSKLKGFIDKKATSSDTKNNRKIAPGYNTDGRGETDSYSAQFTSSIKRLDMEKNMASLTGGLSTFESLNLSYLSNIAYALAHIRGFFSRKSDEEDTSHFEKGLVHNQLIDLFSGNDEFGSIPGQESGYSQSFLEKNYNKLALGLKKFDVKMLHGMKNVTALSALLNPLNIVTGGLFGTSAERTITSMFGEDEETHRRKAIEHTAVKFGIDLNTANAAEVDISQLTQGETTDAIKIKLLGGIASINQGILKTAIEMLNHQKGGEDTFFGSTQKEFESLSGGSEFSRKLKSFRKFMGKIPVLGAGAALFAVLEGFRKNKKEYQELFGETETSEIGHNFKNKSIYDQADRDALFEKQYKFFVDFPKFHRSLYNLLKKTKNIQLGSYSLIENIKEKAFSDTCNICNQLELISRSTMFMAHDINQLTKVSMAAFGEQYKKLASGKINSNIVPDVIIPEYKPKNTKQLPRTMQDYQDEEKEKKYKSKMTKAFDAMIKFFKDPKKHASDFIGRQEKTGGLPGLRALLELMKKGKQGTSSIWGKTKAFGSAVLGFLMGAFRTKSSALIFGASALYLGYVLWNTELGKRVLTKVGTLGMDLIKFIGVEVSEHPVGASIAALGLLALSKSPVINILLNAAVSVFSRVKGKFRTILGVVLIGGILASNSEIIQGFGKKIQDFTKQQFGIDIAEKAEPIKETLEIGALAGMMYEVWRYLPGKTKFQRKLKIGLALGAVLFYTTEKLKGNSIFKGLKEIFINPITDVFGELDETNDPSKQSTSKIIGAVMSALGWGLIAMPNPYARIAGALFIAGGSLANHWGDIKKQIKQVWLSLADAVEFKPFQDYILEQAGVSRADWEKHKQDIYNQNQLQNLTGNSIASYSNDIISPNNISDNEKKLWTTASRQAGHVIQIIHDGRNLGKTLSPDVIKAIKESNPELKKLSNQEITQYYKKHRGELLMVNAKDLPETLKDTPPGVVVAKDNIGTGYLIDTKNLLLSQNVKSYQSNKNNVELVKDGNDLVHRIIRSYTSQQNQESSTLENILKNLAEKADKNHDGILNKEERETFQTLAAALAAQASKTGELTTALIQKLNVISANIATSKQEVKITAAP